jgi:hypothetical protein
MEQFDLNTASVAGKITRLWGRGGDVFARLGVSNQGRLVEKDDAQTTYVTLRFPLGVVDKKPVTLNEGDFVQCNGYLTQNRTEVSLRRFLDTAGADSFLESIPQDDLKAWREIVFRRSSSVLNVRTLTLLEENAELSGPASQVTLEGIVAQRWDYPRGEEVDRFIRVAIYDRWTRTAEESPRNSKNGLPRRLAHYVNATLPEQASQRGIEVRKKQRVRVSGTLRDRGYRVSLHQAMLETGQSELVELIQRCPDTDRLHEITAQWESLHVAAEALIVYSR